jgi:uncharacterized protein
MDYRAAKQFILAKLRADLSGDLYYHGLPHTLDVLRVATALCKSERVGRYNTVLVKTAALYHDAGFVKNQHAGHEQAGCEIVQAELPRFGYAVSDIEIICGMIMATKIPQSPTNLLEKIICDADLDYLGRNDFYTIANNLFRELSAYHLINGEQAWNRLQVGFLQAHHYHTSTNKTLREPAKQANLQTVIDLVATYA